MHKARIRIGNLLKHRQEIFISQTISPSSIVYPASKILLRHSPVIGILFVFTRDSNPGIQMMFPFPITLCIQTHTIITLLRSKPLGETSHISLATTIIIKKLLTTINNTQCKPTYSQLRVLLALFQKLKTPP